MGTNLFKKLTILDKYILKQVMEMFIFGVLIFTGIIFASDTFITLIKQISNFGIPFNVALMIVLLNIPSIVVMAIPMSILLATVMTLNRLCLASEITVMRACSIGLNRIVAPIFIVAILLAGLSFVINETLVPVTRAQSKTLALWALGQKNVPNGKHNFIFKEVGKEGNLKRLFFVDKCENDVLYNIAMLDVTSPGETQILYAKTGKLVNEGWAFEKGLAYNISKNGKLLNNTWFGETVADFGLNLKDQVTAKQVKEYNIIALHKFIEQNKKKNKDDKDTNLYQMLFYDKFAFPVTTFVLVLIGIPLAITPPRVRYNRGFLFSILIIFFFYLIRAFAQSLGESGKIDALLAAWLPNIILFALGAWLYHRKVYRIT